MSVFIRTGSDVLTISGISVCPMYMEMSTSESACPICCRWTTVNFSLSHRFGVVQCFKSKWILHCEPLGFSAPHALKFDLASINHHHHHHHHHHHQTFDRQVSAQLLEIRPQKAIHQNTRFGPSDTFMRRFVRALHEFEKVGN